MFYIWLCSVRSRRDRSLTGEEREQIQWLVILSDFQGIIWPNAKESDGRFHALKVEAIHIALRSHFQ
jgi:hypothetical protein